MKNLNVFLWESTMYSVFLTFLIAISSYGQSDFKRWSIQPSVIGVDLSTASTSINIGGSSLPGEDNISFTNSTTFGIIIDFYLTKNISLHTVLALPPSTEGTGKHSMAGAKAGKLRYGSWPVAAVYHFDFKKLKPFIGVGLNYTMIFNVEEQDILDVDIDPKLGPMLRLGFDYMITDRFGFGASIQKFYVKANITGLAPVSPGITAPAAVEGKLNPWIWTFGGVIRL